MHEMQVKCRSRSIVRKLTQTLRLSINHLCINNFLAKYNPPHWKLNAMEFYVTPWHSYRNCMSSRMKTNNTFVNMYYHLTFKGMLLYFNTIISLLHFFKNKSVNWKLSEDNIYISTTQRLYSMREKLDEVYFKFKNDLLLIS